MNIADSVTQGRAEEPSLTDRAYRELEEMIVTLRLTPGQVLSEGEMVKQLGIGRTPVREALQRLAREGLVVVLPRRGVIVSEINIKSQLELLKLRREVERLMVRLAAERTTFAERRQFMDLAAAMRNSARENDDVGFMRLDREFNGMLAATCRNQFARRAIALTQSLSRRFWYMHYKEVLDLPECALLHADLAEAIGQGDVDAGAAASDILMEYMERFTRASLEASGGTP